VAKVDGRLATEPGSPRLKTTKVVRGVAASLSTAQLTYSMRGDDLRFVVFCFAKAEYAKVFCEEFNGDVANDGGNEKGRRWTGLMDVLGVP
jgi:hypothetical protein